MTNLCVWTAKMAHHISWRACTGSIEYCRSLPEYPRECKRFLAWLLSACCSQGAGHAVDLEACAAADPESAMLRRYWRAGTQRERAALVHWMHPCEFRTGESAHDPRPSVHDHNPTWREFVEGSRFTWHPGANT